MRTVGGISLKISLSFSCALIGGWVGAKAQISLSYFAGNGGKAGSGCVGGGGGWHWEQLLSVMDTGSLVRTEFQRGILPAELLLGLGSICLQGDAASNWAKPLSKERCCSIFLRWPLENIHCSCGWCWY